MVPVHPDDWPLLGMHWQGASYVDTRPPFGLRSAPKIFTAVADALHWIMVHQGMANSIHYLDDFLFVEPPLTTGSALRSALALWESLGVPVAPDKMEGPSTRLCFLGIELDSVSLTARLPADKLARLQQLVSAWGDKKACQKRELLSLIGVLQQAASVVHFGRCFLRRMIDLATSVTELHHHVRLNREFRSDLQWWALFAPRWNGICALTPAMFSSPDTVVCSDASGSWGFGAIWDTHWLQEQWPASWASVNITGKELLPIVMAAGIWGKHWSNKCVELRCDNQAIVGAISSWRSREPLVMHLLWGLAIIAMEFAFHLKAVHIAGTANGAADALSRNDQASFFLQVPRANSLQDSIPPPLARLFLHQQPDWLSDSWKGNFKDFLQRYCRVHCKILCHRPEMLLALLSASSMCSMPCLETSINALCDISSRSGTYVADNQSLSGSRTASSSYTGLPLPGVGRNTSPASASPPGYSPNFLKDISRKAPPPYHSQHFEEGLFTPFLATLHLG